MAPRFQCFLSYNSQDRELVRQLARALKERDVTVWLDLDELPGQPSQEGLVKGLKASRAVAILVGPSGLGPWERKLELEIAVARHVKLGRPRIVPVLLPGAAEAVELPETLRLFTAVDLRGGLAEVERLISVLTARRTRTVRKRPSTSAPPTRPGLHNLPYSSLGRLFQGRDLDLRELSETSAGTARVLHGLGGVGKTRLALEHAWRSGRLHGAALFVLSETRERLRSQLAALAGPELLNLSSAADSEDEARGAVFRWLQDHPGWLLLLDRVDNDDAASAVVEILPRLTAGQVVITSRLTNWPPGLELQEVQPIASQDAVSFLLDRTAGKRSAGPNDSVLAERIAQTLQGLPLALEQAGAYVVYYQLSLAEYLTVWEQERENLLAWADELVMQYPRSLAVTFQQAVQRLTPGALAVLRLLAYFASDPFPLAQIVQNREWFGRALELLGPELGRSVPNESLREAVANLAAHSMAQRHDGQLSIHRLVQEAARAHVPPEHRRDWIDLSLRLVAASVPVHPEDSASWPEWDRLRSHVIQVSRHAEDQSLRHPLWRLMNQLGTLLWAKGLYRDAEPWLRRALMLGRAQLAERPARIAALASNLEKLLRSLGRQEEAEPLLREALALDEATHPGVPHADIALRLNNLALLLQDIGKIDEAEALLRRALAIDETCQPADAVAVARDLGNLASLLEVRGMNVEAESLLQRALALEREQGGTDHPNVAILLNNLAKLRQDDGHPEEAEPLLREAERLFTRHLGVDHPYTIAVQESLASLSGSASR